MRARSKEVVEHRRNAGNQVHYSAHDVRQGMCSSYTAAVLWALFAAFISQPIIDALIIKLGFSPEQIGFVRSLGQLFAVMQIIGIVVQERYFHRVRFWAFFTGIHFLFYGVLALVVLNYDRFSPEAGFWLYAMCMGFAGFAFATCAPIGYSWHANFIPKLASNGFWNRRNACYMLAAMISSYLAASIFEKMDQTSYVTFAIMLVCGMIFGLFSVFMQTRIPDNNPRPAAAKDNPLKEFVAVMRDRELHPLMFFFCLQSVAATLPIAFTNIYAQHIGMSVSSQIILGAISSLIAFFSAGVFQRAGLKFGRRNIMIFCSLCSIGVLLWWSSLTPGNPLWQWGTSWFGVGVIATLPIYLVSGFAGIGMQSAKDSLLTTQGNKKIQGMGIAIIFTAIGIAGALSSLASGYIISILGKLEWISGLGLDPFNVLSLIAAILYAAIIPGLLMLEKRGGKSLR